MHATVLIPAYNTARHLPRCLDSILAQDYSSFDVLVISDGSTDETVAVAEQYALRDPRISLLALPINQGAAGATAIGITHARGEVITVVDSDDVLMPHALATVVPPFVANARLGFLWTRFMTDGGRMGWSGPLPAGETLFSALMGSWWRASHQRTIRKSTYMASMRLTPAIRISSDYQLALVMASTSCDTLFMDKITYKYTVRRPGSITGDGPAKQKAATVEARAYVAAHL